MWLNTIVDMKDVQFFDTLRDVENIGLQPKDSYHL